MIVWVICGILAAIVAGKKGHSGCLWLLLGLPLGPLALLAAVGLPDKWAR